MLCLDRKVGQSFVILLAGKQITVKLLKKTGYGKMQVGIDAPKEAQILRTELLARKETRE